MRGFLREGHSPAPQKCKGRALQGPRRVCAQLHERFLGHFVGHVMGASEPVFRDLNADGIPDLLSYETDPRRVVGQAVVLRLSAGTFDWPDRRVLGTTEHKPEVWGASASIGADHTIGDLDEDGDLDIVVRAAGKALLFRNIGPANYRWSLSWIAIVPAALTEATSGPVGAKTICLA